MSREITPFALRMPQTLREALENSARINKRSLNAELLERLEATLQLDRTIEDMQAGDHSSADSIIKHLLADNSDLAATESSIRKVIVHEVSKLLEDRLSLLESRLLSLPDSSFGKSLKK